MSIYISLLHSEMSSMFPNYLPTLCQFKNSLKIPIVLQAKALSGLKQSPKSWFGRFTKGMITMGYKQRKRSYFVCEALAARG